MKPITSLQNSRFRQALRLAGGRGRHRQEQIIVHGDREVERAWGAGAKLSELFVDERQIAESQTLIDKCTQRSVPVWQLSVELYKKLAYGQRTDGAIGVFQRPSTELASFGLSIEHPLLVVAEAFDKPGNIGAMARTIDAVGGNGLLLADERCDCFHPNAIRASTGCIFSVPIVAAPADAVKTWLMNRKISIVVADPAGQTAYDQTDFTGAVAVVIGSESAGISPVWRGPDVISAKIPMHGHADSLNASVTAAVFLFEASRQRRIAGPDRS